MITNEMKMVRCRRRATNQELDAKPIRDAGNFFLGIITAIMEALMAKQKRELEFVEGEQVLLTTRDLNWKSTVTPKLIPKYIGPFTVKKVLSPLNYELSLPDSMPIHPVFHVSKLEKCIESDETFPNRH